MQYIPLPPWWLSLKQALAEGEDVILVSLLSTRGSAPRGPGTRMVVSETDYHGTIGGGHLEYRMIAMARQMLAEPSQRWHRHKLSLGASLGQCCGGAVEVLLDRWQPAQHAAMLQAESNMAASMVMVLATAEGASARWLVSDRGVSPLSLDNELALPEEVLAEARRCLATSEEPEDRPDHVLEPISLARPELVLFGAGHVGRALVNILGTLPVKVIWYDSRAQEFPGILPQNVHTIIDDDFTEALAVASNGAAALVMTHHHGLDQDIVAAVLSEPRFSYCGLIGSRSKRLKFERRLQQRGFSSEQLAELHCPIGIDGVGGKLPAEIAVSVAADLLRRWGGSL